MLFPHQKIGVNFLLGRNNVLLADDMGLGKTRQAIEIINRDTSIERVVIICPVTLVGVWEGELKRTLIRNLSINKVQNNDLIPFGINIVPYSRLVKKLLDLKSKVWDMLIVDEMHFVKNINTIRAMIICDGGGIAARRKVYMSGTPMSGKTTDLFPMLLHFGEEESLSVFMAKYGRDLNIKNPGHLKEKINKYMIRRTKDILALPSKSRQLIELDSREVQQLLSMEIELVAKRNNLINYIDNLEDFVKELLKLPKIKITKNITAIRRQIGEMKASYVLCFLRAYDQQTVIFFHHRSVGEFLKANLTNVSYIDGKVKGKKRQKEIEKFVRGDTRYFLGNIAACGTGITLVNATRAVFVELDWSPINLLQAEDRIYRIGQGSDVYIDYYAFRDSIDSHILKNVIKKIRNIQKIIGGLK